MENKEWIILIVPIIFNFVGVYIIQFYLNKKSMYYKGRISAKINSVDCIESEFKKMNDFLIDSKVKLALQEISHQQFVESLKLNHVEIIKEYDKCNMYYKKFKKNYFEYKSSFDAFENEIRKLYNNSISKSDGMKLDVLLQNVKSEISKCLYKLSKL